MKLLKFFIILIVAIFFTACSQKEIIIEDVKKYPQNPVQYIDNFQNNTLEYTKLTEDFINKYFSVWKLEKLNYPKEKAMWGNIYAYKEVYLENHRLIKEQLFEKLIDNSNFEEYNSSRLKAITTKNCNFRVLPTNSAIFYNPKKAGEGFPFDYNQNSRVKINTPVFVSHFSKDKAWAFVQSHYVAGWVRVDNLLFVNEDEIRNFQSYPLEVVVKEGFQTFSLNETEELKIGTFFPKKDDKYLLATNNGIKEVSLQENSIKPFPIEFNSKNITDLLEQFIGEPYGWGGLKNHRDCSSFTQDFFTPFSIYLNRNSKAQTYGHKYLDIYKLSDEEKKEFIVKNAIPFLTLIYLKGHIMLYIGSINNEPLVMHNMWGVRTWEFPFNSGRNIVGKTVITTLEPGVELYNANKTSTVLKRVKGIVLLNEKVDK